MSVMKAKVPATVAVGIICLLAGGGLGAAVVGYSQGDRAQQGTPEDEGNAPDDPKGGSAKGAKGGKGGNFKGGKGGFGGGGAPGGGAPGGGGGFGGRGPNSKMQLSALVGKLDVLTREPLHVELTAEQKKEAKELLAGLAEKDELTDDEAKAKLDALLKIVEGNKQTLQDAGYRWPGTPPPGRGGGGAPGDEPPPNPFKSGEAADRLKSLLAELAK